MNKLKKMVVVATITAVVIGLAFNVAIQTADAATKKYTVTVKYVGDDKKTLKTVKKTVKAGTKYKLAKLSSKDKAVHNYAYKSGSKTIKVTKSASYKVTYKRTAYDIKFVSYKSNTGKTYATSKVINVRKGKSYTYQAPTTSGYNTPAKITVKPTKDKTYKVKATPVVIVSTVNKSGVADNKVYESYSKMSNGQYYYHAIFTHNFTSKTAPSSVYIKKAGVVDNKWYGGYFKMSNGQYYYVDSFSEKRYGNGGMEFSITGGFSSKSSPSSAYTEQFGVADNKEYQGYFKLSNGQHYYVTHYDDSGNGKGFASKTTPSSDFVDEEGVADNKIYEGYYKLGNGQYYYVAYSDPESDLDSEKDGFTSKATPLSFVSDPVYQGGVADNKIYWSYYELSNGQYYYVTGYEEGGFTSSSAPSADYVNQVGE